MNHRTLVVRSSVRVLILAVATALALAACSKSEAKAPPPPKPITGAPVAFVVDKVEAEALQVRVYNFTDKKIAQWGILMRYYDAAGNVLKVKVGTAFERDHDFWSMSGRSYTAQPNSWTSFEIDHVDIPAGAVKAEVLASRATALGPDGMTFEDEPVWDLEGRDWPATAN